MSLRDAAVSQYLARYAEQGSEPNWPFGSATFTNVVVVPAFAETPAFICRALERQDPASWLLVVVVNAPTNASASQVEATRKLLTVGLPPPLERVGGDAAGAWHDVRDRRAVWLLDHVSPGRRLAPHHGVGLARKIGMDLALRAIAHGRVQRPQIWCCDADGRWPDNYFEPRLGDGQSALTFAFRHVGLQAQSAAQQVYDLRIRDYPAQLGVAGSPWSFQALGSAMAISAVHYARVRGCPRRAAGEDFHLLAKLAKVGAIRMCPEVTVLLRARQSRRVVFGTGPAVARLAAGGDPWDAPIFYSATSFRALGALLAGVRLWLKQPPPDAGEAALRALLHECLAAAGASGVAVDVLEPGVLWRALARAMTASSKPATRQRHFDTFFDALRTLRMIHSLRDAGLENVSARTLAANEPERLRLAAGAAAQASPR